MPKKTPQHTSDDQDGLDELKFLAALDFEPWPASPTPGPSQEDWYSWNLTHGANLRAAFTIMQGDKAKTTEVAADLGIDGVENVAGCFRESAEFFEQMRTVLIAASGRLMAGLAAHETRTH